MVDMYRWVAVVSAESPLETRRNTTLQYKFNSDAPKHVLCNGGCNTTSTTSIHCDGILLLKDQSKGVNSRIVWSL